jgi:hypothetical protein
MDYRPILKAAADRDFGAFEQGLRTALFEKSLAILDQRAAEVTAAISENREPTDLSVVPASLYAPRLKAALNESDDQSFQSAPSKGKTVLKENASHEEKARAAGWFPTREAHVMFRGADESQVCRHLKGGETYNGETDSLMSRPLRHADSWEHAVAMDKL